MPITAMSRARFAKTQRRHTHNHLVSRRMQVGRGRSDTVSRHQVKELWYIDTPHGSSQGRSGYAQPGGSRWRPTGLPGPTRTVDRALYTDHPHGSSTRIIHASSIHANKPAPRRPRAGGPTGDQRPTAARVRYCLPESGGVPAREPKQARSCWPLVAHIMSLAVPPRLATSGQS